MGIAVAMLSFRNLEPPPDPNDPAKVGLVQAAVLRRNLKFASDAANKRVRRKEITEAQAKVMVAKAADQMLQHVQITKVPAEKAWLYGEVFWTAKRWTQAARLLETAIKEPKNEERRINDTLRLAQCVAALGDFDRAFKLVRSTFDVGPNEAVAIMPSLLFEFAPIVQGHGRDADLAAVLEEAIPAYERTTFDPSTQNGKIIQTAKPVLIRNAQALILALTGQPQNKEPQPAG